MLLRCRLLQLALAFNSRARALRPALVFRCVRLRDCASATPAFALVAIAVEFRVGSVLACGASLILAVQLELFLPAGVGSLLLLCLLLDKLLLLLFDLSLFNDVLRALLEEADEMLVGGADLPVLVVERLTSILLAG